MYCIFYLPRTGSHYLHSLINSSLSYLDPRHIGTELEPFNMASFNKLETVKKKYERFINTDPPTTAKMVINHYIWLAEEFINNPKYTTILIKPQNYRKRLLKALVEKTMKTYSNGTDRRQYREPLLGKLKFSDDMLAERFEDYRIHMEYADRCDHVFYDEFVFSNPDQVLTTLGLPNVTPRYKRVAPYYSDEEMLENVNEYNEQYDRVSLRLFNRII